FALRELVLGPAVRGTADAGIGQRVLDAVQALEIAQRKAHAVVALERGPAQALLAPGVAREQQPAPESVGPARVRLRRAGIVDLADRQVGDAAAAVDRRPAGLALRPEALLELDDDLARVVVVQLAHSAALLGADEPRR